MREFVLVDWNFGIKSKNDESFVSLRGEIVSVDLYFRILGNVKGVK